VPLCTLVLLDTIHEDLQSAVRAAVVQIEAESSDLERFSAAFVLPRINAAIEGFEELIVPGEKRLLVDLITVCLNLRSNADVVTSMLW
jgi:hypothetical protein